MASRELAQALDYILNRCNEKDIEAIAEAVVRRRRDISLFGSTLEIPDPRRLAEKITSQMDIEGNIESLKDSVRDYAARTIRQQAPELSDGQIEELMAAWNLPGERASGGYGSSDRSARGLPSRGQSIPSDLLASMIGQFISFSLGRMGEEENLALRRDIGPWPDRYWKAFPPIVRSLITGFLKGEMDEADFNTRVGHALQKR